MISPSVIKKSLLALGLAVVIYVLFYVVKLDYLLFHTFTEIFTATVAASVFIIAWNSRKIVRNDYLMFLGIVFLFVAGIDSLHTLAYKGMTVFTSFPGSNLATQLWIISRYFFAIFLLVSPVFLFKKLSVRLMMLFCTALAVFFSLSVFYWQNFPVAYVDGIGLTSFKITSEYIIILIFIAAGVLLYRFRNKFDPVVYRNLFLTILFSLVCELFFTLYVGVYGVFNYLGHIAKLFSYYFLYKAVVEVSLDKPYALLFRRLELANTRKEEFIKFLGHELRTPLTTIKLYSEMLEGDLVKEADLEKAEMAKKVAEQTDVMQLLISDLVDVSRLEAGTINFEMRPVDLNKLVADTVATAQKIYQGKEMEFRLEGKIAGQIMADSRRVMQVLYNLMANGIKYSESPVKIVVKMEKKDKYAKISVNDKGAGIPADKLEKIFDKYYRTEEGKNKAKGLGLGLYLAKEIVEKHHGKIEVKSKVGEGSTFTVYLPVL